MEFIKPNINIDFIGKRNIAYIASAVLILVSIVSLLFHGGPRLGIDFAGGTLIQIKFAAAADIASIKNGLGTVDLGGAVVQTFGDRESNEFLIRTDKMIDQKEGFTGELETALQKSTGKGVEVRRIEMVGPQVGQDLREKALLAMFFALLFIAIYISGRFEFKWLASGAMAAGLIGAVYLLFLVNVGMVLLIVSALIITLFLFWFLDLRYAMGATVALIHDVMITVGLFSLFDKEFTLPIIAALLTIIGYSLNDTIIIYDRIRENLRKHHKISLPVLINRSVNETLSRTILTSGTTLIVVVALFVLGGGIIHDFAFAMMVGIIIGTYSTIYVASPLLIAWEERAKRRK